MAFLLLSVLSMHGPPVFCMALLFLSSFSGLSSNVRSLSGVICRTTSRYQNQGFVVAGRLGKRGSMQGCHLWSWQLAMAGQCFARMDDIKPHIF